MGSYVEACKRSLTIQTENRAMKRRLRDHPTSRSRRGEISVFSYGSRRRLIKVLWNNAERFKYFFTITYRQNEQRCKITKQHLDYFLTRFRKACGSDVGFVWVLEFQKRGAVHFHIWIDPFCVYEFDKWKGMRVRRQVQLRFKDSVEDLMRFKFLTYLWLKVSGQLEDEKALKAATDLRVISSNGFIKSYAVKYGSKLEQKQFAGTVDVSTGEIIDTWVGRFWGRARCVRNVTWISSDDIQDVRTMRRWMRSFCGKKGFSGTWMLWNVKGEERVKRISEQIRLERFVRNWVDADGKRN